MSYKTFFRHFNHDAGLYEEEWSDLRNEENWNSDDAFFEITQKYLQKHPEEKNEVKKLLSDFINDKMEQDAFPTEKLYAAAFIDKNYNDDTSLRQQISAEEPSHYLGIFFKELNSNNLEYTPDDRLLEFTIDKLAASKNISNLANVLKTTSSDNLHKKALSLLKKQSQELSYDEKNGILQAIAQGTNTPKTFDLMMSALIKNKNYSWDFLSHVQANNPEILQKLALYKEQLPLSFEDRRAVEDNIQNKNYIEKYLNEKHPQMPFEQQLLKEASSAVTSGDETKKQQFFTLLLSEGEERLFEIDTQIMEYLVNNLTQENLDAVNCLRGLYGIKVSLTHDNMSDGNTNTAKRMQFDNMINEVSNYYFYDKLHSKEYLDLKPNRRRKFNYLDYENLEEESQAFQTLAQFGYEELMDPAIEIFIKKHIPPEIAAKFNIKDINELIAKENTKDIYGSDNEFAFTKSSFNITDVGVPGDIPDARSTFWFEITKHKQLINAISEDLRNHNISDEDINKLWNMAKREGRPNAGGRRGVKDVFFQLHHNRALKDGGENTPDNFVITTHYPGESYGKNFSFSSHAFLHQQDNPLVELYENPDAKTPQDKIATTEPLSPEAKRIRIVNELIQQDKHHRVIYYGGPRQSSCYKGLLRNMTNVAQLTEEKVAKTKAKKDQIKKKIDPACEIVKAFILDKIQKLQK